MNKSTYQWAVVGAGPAGIAAVGRLIDRGISPTTIMWIDPQFKVGDLGQYWLNVSSNTSVRRFLDFLHASAAFAYDNAEPDFRLNHLPVQNTCVLQDIVAPLQWVTNHLRERVNSVCTSLQTLSLQRRSWYLTTDHGMFLAKNVILATGAEATQLNYCDLSSIPLEVAIDREKIGHIVDINNTYAVFGSSHSAMIIIRSLVELGVKKVINFYRSPCRYAIDLGDWILFDNTGLKGDTASWVRENIDGKWPVNLVRYLSNESNIARFLPECQQVIYAVGFSPRASFCIDGYSSMRHNPHHGIIGPGLFGLGIGFPEMVADPFGHVESQVGLWKFMLYLNKVLPLWLNYPA